MNTLPKILLIDDEPEILSVVGLLLSTDGFQVEKAASGAEALKLMSETSFDLVISDYYMPKMNGIELLTKLRQRGDYTSFVFFSGNANDAHGLQMSGLGAYELVPKTQVLSLADVVRKTLKKASELCQIGLDKTEESKDFLKLLHSS